MYYMSIGTGYRGVVFMYIMFGYKIGIFKNSYYRLLRDLKGWVFLRLLLFS